MIYAKGMEIDARGDLLHEIGPELVQLIGIIFDLAKNKIGGEKAEAFICMCVDSALNRVTDELRREAEASADAMLQEMKETGISFEDIIKREFPQLIF